MAFSNDRIHLKLDSSAASSIDAYLEYKRIVGNDDGGKLFTPAEYEAYKKSVIPIRNNNRLFVSWTSLNSGIECKMIGPETKCFCQHRYKEHKTDFEQLPSTRSIKLPCEVRGCKCKCYSYVPLNGTQSIRCTCKHFSNEHSVLKPNKCQKSVCSCNKFHSAYTCGCGDPTYNHMMIIETKTEREQRGRPIGHDVPYKAMGGLTGFSSLADGYMRLDSSGIGIQSKEFLEQPPGPFDHPFLKVHQGMDRLALNDDHYRSTVVERARRTEEEDMAYFEKRYQQRLKQEREQARLKNNPKVLKQTSAKKTPNTDATRKHATK